MSSSPISTLDVLTDAAGCAPRGDAVMTRTPTAPLVSLNHAACSHTPRYRIFINRVGRLRRFRVTPPFFSAHSAHESSRRDDAVWSRNFGER